MPIEPVAARPKDQSFAVDSPLQALAEEADVQVGLFLRPRDRPREKSILVNK